MGVLGLSADDDFGGAGGAAAQIEAGSGVVAVDFYALEVVVAGIGGVTVVGDDVVYTGGILEGEAGGFAGFTGGIDCGHMVSAIGFSIIVFIPKPRVSSTASACSFTPVHMTAKSMSCLSSSL